MYFDLIPAKYSSCRAISYFVILVNIDGNKIIISLVLHFL